MTGQPAVVILGGGLAGVSAAWTLARAGLRNLTLIERGATLGGLAGSFERDGHVYPLGYHHILHRDRALLFFLAQIGVIDQVRWRRIRMLFHAGGQRYDLTSASGFLRFPMSLVDKLRFARLMLHASRTTDWQEWEGRSAAELVERYASPGVRRALFEPLTQLRFEMPCSDVSAAWLGARLNHREGSAPLGYIPHTNWTTTLCEGVTRLIANDVRVLTNRTATKLHTSAGRVSSVELDDGTQVGGDLFVSTVPTEVFTQWIADDTPEMSRIRYSALISAVCATRTTVTPEFYWMNLSRELFTACGIFVLSSLNPTIGGPGETCVNFVTHLRTRKDALFTLSADELLHRYRHDFKRALGIDLEPTWTQVSRVGMYAPIFDPQWRNPPVRSTTWSNVYFGGNYRTFPSVVSTGTALRSGVDTGAAVLHDLGATTDLLEQIDRFTPPRLQMAGRHH